MPDEAVKLPDTFADAAVRFAILRLLENVPVSAVIPPVVERLAADIAPAVSCVVDTLPEIEADAPVISVALKAFTVISPRKFVSAAKSIVPPDFTFTVPETST